MVSVWLWLKSFWWAPHWLFFLITLSPSVMCPSVTIILSPNIGPDDHWFDKWLGRSRVNGCRVRWQALKTEITEENKLFFGDKCSLIAFFSIFKYFSHSSWAITLYQAYLIKLSLSTTETIVPLASPAQAKFWLYGGSILQNSSMVSFFFFHFKNVFIFGCAGSSLLSGGSPLAAVCRLVIAGAPLVGEPDRL